MNKVQIYILSGMLGSGKTTLLAQLLQLDELHGKKSAVIMNEAGAISIDTFQIPRQVPLTEIINGCVCCSQQSMLEGKLLNLLEDKRLDTVYIETSGIAHPMEVLDACSTPFIVEQATVRAIITVCNYNQLLNQSRLTIKMRKLYREQLIHADMIYLSKDEQISKEERREVLRRIKSVNQNVLVSSIPSELETPYNPKRKQADLAEHFHIKTIIFTFKKRVNPQLFQHWVNNLPDNIYRIKGYIPVQDSLSCLQIQYSFGMPTFIKESQDVPWNLVFIGEAMEKDTIISQLREIEHIS